MTAIRRASTTKDAELKELLDKCLNQSQAQRMDNPFVWSHVISPILLLHHYKLENQQLTAALIMEVRKLGPGSASLTVVAQYIAVDRQRKRPTSLVNFENVIWKEVILAADGRQTLAKSVANIIQLHHEMKDDFDKTTPEERAYFITALERTFPVGSCNSLAYPRAC